MFLRDAIAIYCEENKMLRETYKYETTNGIYSYIIENNKVSITSMRQYD